MPGLTVSAAERISNCSISVQKNNYHSEQEKKNKPKAKENNKTNHKNNKKKAKYIEIN